MDLFSIYESLGVSRAVYDRGETVLAGLPGWDSVAILFITPAALLATSMSIKNSFTFISRQLVIG